MKHKTFFLLILLVPFLAAAGAAGDRSSGTRTEPADVQEAEAATGALFFDYCNNDRLTGDWGGARTSLEEKGIEIGLWMTQVFQQDMHGGLRTHRSQSRSTGSADYELTFDFASLGFWDDAIFYVLAESDWNVGLGEDRIENLFGVNGDAGGDLTLVVDEAWYEHTFWDGKARFRIGKMDVGVDFDTNAYANDETLQFLNPALINTGNIPMPDFGLGAQLVFEPVDWFFVAIVGADAQADGRETGFATAVHDEDHFFAAVEVGFLPVWDTPRGKLSGGYRFGVWYDPQPKERFFNDLGGILTTVPSKRDDVGFYVSIDQMLLAENPDADSDDQGLGMFFRYGFAHEESNELEHFWSVGGQYQGLVPTRDGDVLGFGFAQGVLSGTLRHLDGGDRESVYELYYSAEVHPWLVITPDLQYIVNPGADKKHGRDALVAGVRLQMSF